MSESRKVTLSAGASAAVKRIAERLNLPFEEALGVAIGTQAEILRQIDLGRQVAIAKDGKTLQVTIPAA